MNQLKDLAEIMTDGIDDLQRLISDVKSPHAQRYIAIFELFWGPVRPNTLNMPDPLLGGRSSLSTGAWP